MTDHRTPRQERIDQVRKRRAEIAKLAKTPKPGAGAPEEPSGEESK
jgi:hypothetical protein